MNRHTVNNIWFDEQCLSFVSYCNQWISPVRWSDAESPGKLLAGMQAPCHPIRNKLDPKGFTAYLIAAAWG